jgi:thiamine biosynthesis lipoprotein
MGTEFRIVVYAADSAQAENTIERAFARVDTLERITSDYRNDSELNRLSRTAGRDTCVRVSEDLWNVLRLAQRVSRRSRGAFDVSIGPLSKLWRRAFRQREMPAAEDLALAQSRVNNRWIKLRKRDHSVRLRGKDMRLDLGGIAKGYAIDAAAAVLREAGINRLLVDGGGDLYLGDPPPGRSGWRVRSPQGETELHSVAIATSGDQYRYLEWKGRRYSHLIDPRTGYGVTHRRSVTVQAATAAVADALASAASILVHSAQAEQTLSRLERAFDARILSADVSNVKLDIKN